ncbi:MAG: hypothetical protein WBW94_12185 [Anaerolineales bacterium]
MDSGEVISVVVFVGFWIVFLSIMFWVYGLSPILHWFIKSNGEPAKAVILEVRKAGWGWYSGSRYSQSLVFQPVTVKLEVHPNNGAPYVTKDKFNAKPREFWETLKPGSEMQVSIARFNSQWVASWPETAVETHEAKYNEPVHHVINSNTQAGAPTAKNNNTLFIVIGIVVALLCCCLIVVGGFAYSRYVAGKTLSGINNQIATVTPGGLSSPVPVLPSESTAVPSSGSAAAAIPTGGLADEPTRATAWGSAIAAIVEANPTSCPSPDAAKTMIVIIYHPKASGIWQERWTVACDGASPIPVNITFTPASGGLFTVKATVVK